MKKFYKKYKSAILRNTMSLALVVSFISSEFSTRSILFLGGAPDYPEGL